MSAPSSSSSIANQTMTEIKLKISELEKQVETISDDVLKGNIQTTINELSSIIDLINNKNVDNRSNPNNTTTPAATGGKRRRRKTMKQRRRYTR